jgi:hypothetical protein
MIPVTQTKVVVRNSKNEMVVRGNCYAAAIASILEMPIEAVPNVEVLFHIEDSLWSVVMQRFINSIGWEMFTDDRFRVFHNKDYGVKSGKRDEWVTYCKNKYYFISGQSKRGVQHMVIYKNGKMVHDPHPTKEGIITIDYFEYLEKVKK